MTNKVSMTMKTLTTERLLLRMANSADAAFILELYNSDDFVQFVGDKKLFTVEDAERYIQTSMLDMHEQKGVCLLVVESKSQDKQLGVCGLIKRDELEAYDLGYGFLPGEYRQGYGFESAQAVISYAKEREDIKDLVAITTSDNISSQKLLTKLGFTYIKVQKPISDTIDLLLYQLSLVEHETYTQ